MILNGVYGGYWRERGRGVGVSQRELEPNSNRVLNTYVFVKEEFLLQYTYWVRNTVRPLIGLTEAIFYERENRKTEAVGTIRTVSS